MPLPPDPLICDTAALQRYRMEKGLTISALAVKAGVTAACASRIESGVRRGAPETLTALAKALGVPVARILTKKSAAA